MRPILIFTISFTIILSCNSTTTENKSEPVNNTKSTPKIIGNKFFAYDEIDYYATDFDEAKIPDLYDNTSKSEIDSLKMVIILGETPKNIADLSFIDQLEIIGFKKTSLNKSTFNDIDKIFVEKSTTENIATSCIPAYRDILIFKKDRNVVGTAKVCFGCMEHQINGTTANTVNFGQEGDYQTLKNLLRGEK